MSQWRTCCPGIANQSRCHCRYKQQNRNSIDSCQRLFLRRAGDDNDIPGCPNRRGADGWERQNYQKEKQRFDHNKWWNAGRHVEEALFDTLSDKKNIYKSKIFLP